MPVRIQRKRTKGWRKPEGAVYVGRPTKWGNPWATAEMFRKWMAHGVSGSRHIIFNAAKQELKGKDLMCWCPLDSACHADVLLEIANES